MKNLRGWIALIMVFGFYQFTNALHFKDSTSALFLRVSFKSVDDIYINPTADSIYTTFSEGEKSPRGFIVGLRYSSTFKSVPNNRLSYWAVLDFHYDKFVEELVYDSFPFSFNYTNPAPYSQQVGRSTESVTISQGSITFQIGVKYNFRRIRPAIGYYAGYNIFSNSKGFGYIGKKFEFFKENGKVVNAFQHGIKLDLYIPATKKLGIVLGAALSFDVKIPHTSSRFNNIGSYAHAGVDYKLGK